MQARSVLEARKYGTTTAELYSCRVVRGLSEVDIEAHPEVRYADRKKDSRDIHSRPSALVHCGVSAVIACWLVTSNTVMGRSWKGCLGSAVVLGPSLHSRLP